MKISKLFGIAAPVMAGLLVSPAYAQSDEGQEWAGAYIGGSFGVPSQANDDDETLVFDTNLDGDYGDTVNTTAPADAFSPGFCGGAATSTANSACRNDRNGFEYNGRIGYDMQSGNIVYGVLLEGGKSEARDSVSGYSTTPASYTMTREIDYQIGARARLGYAARGALFYVTGGGVYAKLDNSFTTSNTANSFSDNGKSNGWGYSAGGGAEIKVAKNLSLGVEYLYNNIKDDDYTVNVGPGTANPLTNPFLLVNPAGTDIKRSDKSFETHNIRVTAAFRF